MKICNPVGITDIGDPFVLRSGGRYYLYATSAKNGFKVWQGDDLNNLKPSGLCYKKNKDSFGTHNFWAPEVIERNGEFIMHYSAALKNGSLRIGVAVSKSPLGPFKDVEKKQPMFDFGYAAIDGHVFTDDNGKNYFYFSRDCSENIIDGKHVSQIYVADLSEDCLKLTSEPKFLISPTLEYEAKKDDTYIWNEGPYVLKHNGKYHLMYSANYYACKDYCVCCAVSHKPDGEFVKYDNVILKYVDGLVSGPGHNSITTDEFGNLICVYHVHTHVNAPDGNRQVFFDKLIFENDKIKILGPTLG